MRSLAAVAFAAALALLVAPTASAAGPAPPPTSVRATSGADAAAIDGTVNQFRADLGGARREINWDDVPDAQATPNPFPAAFFKARGALFSTPGTGFRVSATGLTRFADLNLTYATAFATYSPERLFTPQGDTTTDVTFSLPGTENPATVNGFGAVFTDVDDAASSSLQFFDPDGNDLGTFLVPPKPAGADDASLSFLGVRFIGGHRVAKVRVVSGGAAPAASVNDTTQGGPADVVVLDDFIYAEPQPSISIGPSHVNVDEAEGAIVVNVVRSPGGGAGTVDVRTSDGSAKAGQDYTPVAGTVSFAPGETSKQVSIPVLADNVQEPTEFFNVALTNPTGSGAVVDPSAIQATIGDSTPPPTVAPPRTTTTTTTTDVTPPSGGVVGVPTSMRLASLVKKGVTFQVLRNDRSSAVVALEGAAKKATIAATYNLALVTKTLAAGTGRKSVTLKPPKALVGTPKKLSVRVRLILTDAAGNRAAVVRTITVKR